MDDKCIYYEKQTSEGLNMVVSKDPTVLSVTVFAKDQISKCLKCPQILIGCPTTAEFVRYLDENTPLYHDKPKQTR